MAVASSDAPQVMRACVVVVPAADDAGGRASLDLRSVPRPSADALGPADVLLRVLCCAACRTDLHILDGDLAQLGVPPAAENGAQPGTQQRAAVVLGHQVVGRVAALGADAARLAPGLRVGARAGVPWLGGSCGVCAFCAAGEENLCDAPVFTGLTRDGGFAEWVVADACFVFPIPERFASTAAAPLLCGGLIGFRALRFATAPAWGRDFRCTRIGLMGYGSAAHILTQVCVHQGRAVFAFTRAGDEEAQALARRLGAHWAGASDEYPPGGPLDAVIVFAPVGALTKRALERVRKGGRVILAGIHASPTPPLPYSLLWGERMIQSVANLQHQDGVEFLRLASEIGIAPEVQLYAGLGEVARCLEDLREGRITGSGVVVIAPDGDDNG